MGNLVSSLVGGSGSYAESPENSRVQAFHSSPRWHLYFNQIKDSPKLVVIDFSASWCGPCKFIEPAIHAMSQNFTDVDFVKIDVDELSEVAQEYGVQAMPTFVLLKKGKEIDNVVGAKKEELEKKIEKHRAA
ncbi:thioredoxin H2-like [Cajanus cajan]|uniref:thioredoxin H2-like n=1 Tax=Cajanus cajan TaxID=3821 RepID=UPI00098DAD7B|nr:thioredoxin H2-like [Cajanus cajan]